MGPGTSGGSSVPAAEALLGKTSLSLEFQAFSKSHVSELWMGLKLVIDSFHESVEKFGPSLYWSISHKGIVRVVDVYPSSKGNAACHLVIVVIQKFYGLCVVTPLHLLMSVH